MSFLSRSRYGPFIYVGLDHMEEWPTGCRSWVNAPARMACGE
jgi:hypothetical protein